LQNALTKGREPIGLPAAGTFLFLEALDPAIVEQATQGAVQGTGAEANASVAHFFGIAEDGVTVTRLLRKTEENQENRFANRGGCHISLNDMSSGDIL